METTKKITEEMFNLPNAGEVILNLVKQGAEIDKEIHLKVFDLPQDERKEILLEYFYTAPSFGRCKKRETKIK